uniref:PMS1 protein homolog 1 n=1 Tax=Cacopsylla melanoneura TaxID=428564 RepID=A0A8D8WUZ2_9HEMI
MSSINILPQATIRRITTSQIITSVSTAVKELMENAIDANATSIHINLIKQGLDLIEVKDDGCGIPSQDVPLICQAATTSKISNISDLDSLSSYGFRGEALNALCQIGEVSVTTKTSSEQVASLYKFNSKGEVTGTQPSHFPNGTTISVRNLFHNLPVRKQFLSSKNRMSEELKKVERVVKCLSLIHCKLRVTLCHNQCVIWQKNQVANIRMSLSQVIPLNIVSNLHDIEYISPVHGANILLLLPKKSVSDLSALCLSKMELAYFIYVNKRPVRVGKIEKMLSKELSECFRSLIPNNKYPVCLVSMEVPSDAVDVNLEPNKTKVLLREIDELVACIKGKINEYYYDPEGIDSDIKPGTKRKLPSSPNEDQAAIRKVKLFVSEEHGVRACRTLDTNQIGDTDQVNADSHTSKIEDRNINNVTETTLSQLSFLVEAKENAGYNGGKESVNRNNSTNNVVNETEDIQYNANMSEVNGNSVDNFIREIDTKQSAKIGEPNNTNLANIDLDNLNEIIPFDSVSENTDVKQQRDSAYHSGENVLDSSFGVEIYESSQDLKPEEISRTQWSKGNVIRNGKTLEEPSYVPGLNRMEEREREEVKNRGKGEFESFLEEDSQYVNDTLERNLGDKKRWNISDDSNVVDENTLYFHQTSNQKASENDELNLDHSNNATFDQSHVFGPASPPGTPSQLSKKLEHFSNFANEMRADILENKGAVSVGKVASQMVNKYNSLHDSGEKRQPAKRKENLNATTKPKETGNKSMLEFVSKKVVRTYSNEETISVNMTEIRLRILEKSHRKETVESNEPDLSSEESDTEEGSVIEQKPDVTSINNTSLLGNIHVDERWNYLIDISNSLTESDGMTHLTDSNSQPDNKYIHGILLKKYNFRIIGSYDENWFYKCANSIGVINTEHLYKIVTFHRLLRTFEVPCVDLEDCIVLDTLCLHTVLAMDLRAIRLDTKDTNVTILKPIDKLFTLNGVGLWIRKNHSRDEYSILLCQKPKDLPAFTSKDAAELLSLGNTKSMEACRPVKVQKLIQSFTEEHCASHAMLNSREALIELISYWFEHIRRTKCPFLYDRKVLYELYLLPQLL